MANFLRYLSSLVFIFSAQVFAEDSTSKTIEKFFPKSLSEKLSYDGSVLTLDNGGLSYIYKEARLARNSSEKDLVVLYQAWTATSTSSCVLSVVRVERNKAIISDPTTLNNPQELSNCDDLSLVDFDGNGTSEIVVTRADERGHSSFFYVFEWKENKLIDITPSTQLDGEPITALRTYKLTTIKDGRKLILVDSPNVTLDSDAATKTYLLNGSTFELQGSYDFFQIIDSKSVRSNPVIFNPVFPAEGEYTLTVKNISDHNRAVRAEVTVNGNIVLRPQDFCSAPPRPKKDKKWWFGHDDDDDHDENHCKRCISKNEAYTIVNMKTTNEIKVKVYGRKDSKVELMLVKK